MGDIVVSKNGNSKWSGSYEGRHIVSGACKECIIHALILVTKKTQKYKRILVMTENGREIERTIEIGVVDAGNTQNTQQQG